MTIVEPWHLQPQIFGLVFYANTKMAQMPTGHP